MKLEIDNGQLVWQPTKVIYKGKEYPAPVYLTTLQSMDYIVNLLKTGEWKKQKNKMIYALNVMRYLTKRVSVKNVQRKVINAFEKRDKINSAKND